MLLHHRLFTGSFYLWQHWALHFNRQTPCKLDPVVLHPGCCYKVCRIDMQLCRHEAALSKSASLW